MAQNTNRRDLLMEASDLVDGERNATYGDPIQDFSRTGRYWGIHLSSVLARRFSLMGILGHDNINVDTVLSMIEDLVDPHDVAIMMMQLKHSRLAWSPEKHDHWVDAAGYAACGWDCVVRQDAVM